MRHGQNGNGRESFKVWAAAHGLFSKKTKEKGESESQGKQAYIRQRLVKMGRGGESTYAHPGPTATSWC